MNSVKIIKPITNISKFVDYDVYTYAFDAIAIESNTSEFIPIIKTELP